MQGEQDVGPARLFQRDVDVCVDLEARECELAPNVRFFTADAANGADVDSGDLGLVVPKEIVHRTFI